MLLVGCDVGGTFTDAVVAYDGQIATAKAPTTPADQSEGVLAAVTAALQAAGASAEDVDGFAHGMTVATNALLEGRGARTVLVATEGFTDVVELGRQARADLYRLCARGPEPLVPPPLRLAAPERMTPSGPLRALDADAAAAIADAVAACEPEAVAVTLLHSYRHPEHELAIGAALRERLPDVHISLSHELVGTFREYERAATTEVDAALSPLLAGYLRRLGEACDEAGLPAPAIMQSTGGLCDLEAAAAHAALTVLSGPAGGAAGAAFAAARAGIGDAVGFDMGGTSCDVCVISDGRVRETAGRDVGGRPLSLPALDIDTVGAGGGSIAWRDGGGAMRVGPRSAGAVPGPACYGRGGSEPTVTDANLLLGRLDPGSPLAGGVRLDRVAAERAIGGLASDLGLEPMACAEGIVRVAGDAMARAIRVMTVERGIDPRELALMPFGGAGGLHAMAIADELGITRVCSPAAGGVLAALGMVVSGRRRDAQRSLLLRGSGLSAEAVAREVAAVAAQARDAIGPADGVTLRVGYDLRYAGQAFELTVDGGETPMTPGELRAAFAAAHTERYGYEDPDGEVELVTIRVSALVAAPPLDPAGGDAPRPQTAATTRPVRLDGANLEAAVWRGVPAVDVALRGPAVVELATSTLLVPTGWTGRADADATIVLERAS
jgi:N-methylhydantoinase A